MIGALPTTLNVNGVELKIRTDYRVCLLILQAFQDTELSDVEKNYIMLNCLYEDFDNVITDDNYTEATEKAVWFLNCGDTISKPQTHKPLYNFEQDEQIIFSAVNKVANKEIRSLEYLHFWTFLAYFNEIGEGIFSTVVSIRSKKQKNKKLEQWERDFYRNNKELVDLKRKYTPEEQESLNTLNELLGIK